MWTVSRILNINPFGDEMREMSPWQFDWIIEMWAADNPDAKITRPGEVRPESVAKAWSEVMIDDLKTFGGMISSAAVAAAKKLRKEHGHPDGRRG